MCRLACSRTLKNASFCHKIGLSLCPASNAMLGACSAVEWYSTVPYTTRGGREEGNYCRRSSKEARKLRVYVYERIRYLNVVFWGRRNHPVRRRVQAAGSVPARFQCCGRRASPYYLGALCALGVVLVDHPSPFHRSVLSDVPRKGA